MLPEEWLKQLSEIGENSEEIADFTFSVKQDFINQSSNEEIIAFYEKALLLFVDKKSYDAIHIKSTALFEQELEKVLNEAIIRASKDSKIKAIYLEYFFDGGPACSCDVSLCRSYDSKDDEWASDFAESDFFAGPSIFEFFNFDEDILSQAEYVVANEYVEAVILTTVIKVVQKLNRKNIPFGFGAHCSQVYHLKRDVQIRKGFFNWFKRR